MLKFLRIILVLTLLNISTAEKILVIPFFNTSLTMMANSIANQLVNRNHSVTWLWPQDIQTEKILDNAKYQMIT